MIRILKQRVVAFLSPLHFLSPVLFPLLALSFFLTQSQLHGAILPFAPDEVIPQFESVFAEEGIDETYSPESMSNLILFTEKLLKETQRRLKEKDYGKFSKGWYERKEKHLKHSLDSLQMVTTTSPHDEIRLTRQFNESKGIIYMVQAEEASDLKQQQRGSLDEPLDRSIEVAIRIVKKAKIVHVDLPDFKAPLGPEKAEKEAHFLVDPLRGNKMVSQSELAQMTPWEVGQLDIPHDHPMWHTKEYMKAHPDIWMENEKLINREATEFINKEHRVSSEYPQFQYDLHKAQKVLFFDEMKYTGTSAKINADDAFNLRWKVKWSAEIHPEVILNRLYLTLGGRYVDPVYATRQGSEGMTLILPEPKEKPEQDGECHPVTAEDLVACFKESKFRFDLRPFIYSSGVITQDNYREVLKHLPAEALKDYRPKKLIGRGYVTFNESLLEFTPKDLFSRGGPISWTRFGAREDRVKRGLLLFNSWLNNTDPNEENNVGVLLPQSMAPERNALQSEQVFVTSQHDMGRSLDGILEAGNPNKLSTRDFIFTTENTVGFRYFLIFLPGAWMRTTYADLLWMGEKIVQVSREQIEDIVALTYWPDFMQEAMVYKIVSRRNRIAEILNLQHLLPKGEELIEAPSFQVPLGTVEERKAAAVKYKVPYEELEKAYNLRPRGEDYHDVVLREGRVALCESTLLIRLMHRYSHPTGLDRRLMHSNLRRRIERFKKVCGGLVRIDAI